MKKIIIIGQTGSGKTTLANKLSLELDIPVYHLDKIFWREKGGIKQDIFILETQEILSKNEWIIDGNFPKSKTFDERINNADTIIYLNLSLVTIFWRQLKRYIQFRNKIRPDLGHKQTFPFKWEYLKYTLTYPNKEIISKIKNLGQKKKLIFIKNLKDEKNFLKNLKSQNKV